MEDCNMIAADCVVISCCCQCLVLQFLVFLLLKLPYKLLQKTKNCAKKKLWRRHRKRGKKVVIGIAPRRYADEFIGIHGDGGSNIRFQVAEVRKFVINEGNGCRGCCMEEVDKVLGELSQRGEFAFGSFWGGEETEGFHTFVAKKEHDNDIVEYHMIEMIGSFCYSS